MSAQETKRQPKIEPAPNSDAREELRTTLLLVAGGCIGTALTAFSQGNSVGGLIAFGVGVVIARVAIRIQPQT